MAAAGSKKVTVEKVIEKMELTNLTPGIDLKGRTVRVPDLNRPALQLAGFWDLFDRERIQVIGLVENDYVRTKLTPTVERERYEQLFSYNVPAVIFCRGLQPSEQVVTAAEKHGIPLLQTKEATSAFSAEIIRWLNVQLAPSVRIHGVLVDVYGVGVLIMGESGIGKSEAALELIKRGHRLVSDDAVEISRVSEDTLVGTSPDVTQYFIELRGIGIVDVKTLFGVASVKDTMGIDLVIRLEEWDRNREYDRLGMEEQYTEILGNKLVCYNIPIRPGRNLAVIVESAAANYRQRRMGYNAAQELYNRVTRSMQRNEE